MRHLKFRFPVLLLAGLILLLHRDHLGLVRMALAASLVHELGHVAVFFLVKGRWPVLCVSPRGIGMDLRGEWFSPAQQLWLAAAGPLVNFLLCAGVCLWLGHRASYAGYFFASVNLCVGLFNLLPFGELDGRRIIEAVWQGRG